MAPGHQEPARGRLWAGVLATPASNQAYVAVLVLGFNSICLESCKGLEQSGVSKRWDFEELGIGALTWPRGPASFKLAPRVSFSRDNLVFSVLGTGEGVWLPLTSACQIVGLLIILVGEVPGVWGP